MKIGICSGYFQRFHEGHKRYLLSSKEACDKLVVIINNDRQQQTKYRDFKKIKSAKQIAQEITKDFEVLTVEAIDKDGSVCKTLQALRKKYPSDDLFFCKDADRTLDNIPEKAVLEKENIKLLQLTNPKENSSTVIMEKED